MADPITNSEMDEPEMKDDVEMEGASGDVDIVEAADYVEDGTADTELQDATEEPPRRITFLDYLKSPIVELVIGASEGATVLSAHQDLLTKSPYFEQKCAEFAGSAGPRRIDLPEDDLEAMGSFLEYLYNGEYFPRRIGNERDGPLEADPSIPVPDNTGAQLLKHARVYTLAGKFFMPALKSLAHSKIHRTTSTARGEIAYARYVYASTPKDDTTIRKPVAAFWATRSHVLRHEAEEEFRAMCLEYPQFGFDVLSLVLDQKEKRGGGGEASVAVDTPSQTKGRKRVRVSAI